jgi:hypothetical protein
MASGTQVFRDFLTGMTPRRFERSCETNLAEGIHKGRPSCRNQRCGAVLHDDRRPAEPVPGTQAFPLEKRSLHSVAIEIAFCFLFDGRMGASDSWQFNSRREPRCSATYIDNLDRATGIRVAIGTFMGLMKRGDKVCAGRNAQMVRLPYIAQVESVFEPPLVLGKALSAKKIVRFPAQLLQRLLRLAACLRCASRCE